MRISTKMTDNEILNLLCMKARLEERLTLAAIILCEKYDNLTRNAPRNHEDCVGRVAPTPDDLMVTIERYNELKEIAGDAVNTAQYDARIAVLRRELNKCYQD